MGNPIETPRLATGDEPQRPKFDPYTGKPLTDEPPAFYKATPTATVGEQIKNDAEPSPIPLGAPVNPYAPTGWQKKNRPEFDVQLPSGQLARVMRLEREDLFRMNLMGYLDTFTPMLMEDTISGDERARRIREKMSNDSNAVSNMFMAIDEVVMAATVRPKVTDDPNLADYGSPADWSNPKFVATALINDIVMDDRFAIFAAAFGRSMDDLKSLFEQTPSVASVADQSSVLTDAE